MCGGLFIHRDAAGAASLFHLGFKRGKESKEKEKEREREENKSLTNLIWKPQEAIMITTMT